MYRERYDFTVENDSSAFYEPTASDDELRPANFWRAVEFVLGGASAIIWLTENDMTAIGVADDAAIPAALITPGKGIAILLGG